MAKATEKTAQDSRSGRSTAGLLRKDNGEFSIPTAAELEKMRDSDVRTVSIDTLTDIRDVKVDENLPREERVLDFIRQIGNPYCYKVGEIAVKVSFAGKCSLEDAVRDCILSGL